MKTKFRIVIAAVTACLAMVHVKAYGQNVHVVSGAAPDEIVSFDAESEGTSTQAIHTTFDDEIRWPRHMAWKILISGQNLGELLSLNCLKAFPIDTGILMVRHSRLGL